MYTRTSKLKMVIHSNYNGYRFCSASCEYTYGLHRFASSRPPVKESEVNCLVSNGHNETCNDNLCLFRAIAIHLFGSVDVELHATEIFHNFITASGCQPESFTGVSFDQIPIIEELIKQNVFIYDFDIENGEIIGELVRRSVERYDKNIKRLRYNNHICYVNDINNFFKKFRCPSCDVFFNHSGNFNCHLKTCIERVENVYPRGAYFLRETLFEKLDNFSIAYPEDHTLFRNFVVFDFEAICVQSVEINKTATTSWIGTHVPVSVSVSSNLLDEPVFLCEKDPNRLIISFVAQLVILTAKNKADLRPKFLAVEAEIKASLSDISSRLQIASEINRISVVKQKILMYLKAFYKSSKSSSLISSVISTIMLTLYQFLDSTVENIT